jgi:hypothetical protein
VFSVLKLSKKANSLVLSQLIIMKEADQNLTSNVYKGNQVFIHRNQLEWKDKNYVNGTQSCVSSFFHWMSVNFRDYMLFGYFTPYMKRAAYQGGSHVQPEFLPPLKKRDDLSMWSERFRKAASREYNRKNGPSRFSLGLALSRVFWTYFIAILFLKFFKIILDILASRSLKRFILYKQQISSESDITARATGSKLIKYFFIIKIMLANIFLFFYFSIFIRSFRCPYTVSLCFFLFTSRILVFTGYDAYSRLFGNYIV